MNKKDVEHIGMILSDSSSFSEVKQRLFEMDSRIECEYNTFEDCAGRNKQVEEIFHKLMVERYGHSWVMLKATTKEVTSAVFKEARKEVYGDDYTYIFGKE